MTEKQTAHADADVVVVGGRTTGLMLAVRLTRQGVKLRIVDASPGIDPHSRATLLHSRSLELLANLGVTEEVVSKGQMLRGMRLFVDGQYVMGTKDPPVDSPYPYGIAFSQKRIEGLLERELTALGVAVERNTSLVSLEQDRASVRAQLRHHDGRHERVEAAFLVGCDGAHSATRHLLDIGFPGTQSRYPYFLADVIAGNDTPSDAWFYFLHREGSLVFAVLDGGRRQIFGNLPADHPAEAQPDLSEIQGIVDRRSEGEYRLRDPRWLTYFRIHYRLAERFRKGRVFLAGDAAHLNSLVGGHGMNTGIQDACNLAWKLAMVHGGLASEAMLDSYEAERRPVAAQMVEASRAFTEPGENYPTMSEAERDAMFKGFQKTPDDLMAFRRNFEELDLDYGASPLSFDEGTALPEDLRPGLEARDVAPLLHQGKTRHLFDLLGGPRHCLLLFAGEPVALTEARARVQAALAHCGSWIEPHLVVTRAGDGRRDDRLSIVLDPEARLTRRYGMEQGGLYLIRPDGYVAYRSRRWQGLNSYVERVILAV